MKRPICAKTVAVFPKALGSTGSIIMLEQEGFSFVPGDTGIGSIILRSSDGTLEGAVSPYSPLDAAAVVFD